MGLSAFDASAAAPPPMTATQRLTLVAMSLGLGMIFLDALIVNVGLPDIQASFGVGESGLQWVVTAYSLGMAVAIMSSATLADVYGRRRLFIAGIVLFAASSAACGLAPNLALLNVARGAQGISGATITVTSLALVSAAFPEAKQKARAIGMWNAIASCATAVGPTIGGFMIEHLGWRSIFLVNLPIALVVIALTVKFVAESRDDRPRRLDLPGQALFAIAVGAFAYAMIEAPRAGWLSGTILALFALSAAALAAFVRVERRSADPMMDVSLFLHRTYALAIVTIFAQFLAIYGMLLVITQYFQNVRGYPPQDTGMLLLPFSTMIITVSLLVGRAIARVGTRPPILLGLAITIAGLVVMAAGLTMNTLVVGSGLALAAAGAAMCLTPVTSVAMSSVDPERAGMAAGIMSAQRAIGSSVGFAVLGSVLAAWLGATLDRDLVAAIPDPAERRVVAEDIVRNANPRAFHAEIGPGRPIQHPSAATKAAILSAADGGFVAGIRVALGVAIALLVVVLLAAVVGLPRAPPGAMAAPLDAPAG
jgi:EmrB/QacA subfamily drug resistance transporter